MNAVVVNDISLLSSNAKTDYVLAGKFSKSFLVFIELFWLARFARIPVAYKVWHSKRCILIDDFSFGSIFESFLLVYFMGRRRWRSSHAKLLGPFALQIAWTTPEEIILKNQISITFSIANSHLNRNPVKTAGNEVTRNVCLFSHSIVGSRGS